MGRDSKIEWTHHTWNPWWGCVKVSPGCEHCYAETFAKRTGHQVWGPAKTTSRRLFGAKHWQEPRTWDAIAAERHVRYRVFCASMADVFEDHPDVVDARNQLWALIHETPNLDWLLLTKRPENIERMMPERWAPWNGSTLPPNVWLGMTAENQDEFDTRWPILESFARRWYALVTFLSIEPLLGPINIHDALVETDLGDDEQRRFSHTVDWVIVGGESGPKARPMHPQWVRAVRDQCGEAHVPFFFKQWGAFRPTAGAEVQPGDVLVKADGSFTIRSKFSGTAWLDEGDVVMRPMDKRQAGRDLDGRTWDELPEWVPRPGW